MNKFLSIFLFLFFAANSIASPCIWSVSQQYINADIVATVKITKSFPEWSNELYHQSCFVEAEIIGVYKGISKSNSIRINYFCDSMMELYLPINTEWIVFLNEDNNQYTTNSCSASKQIDKVYNEDFYYPNYNKQYKQNIEELISLLENLKDNKVNISNNLFILNTRGYSNFLKTKNELNFKNKYAFYKIIFNSDFSIKKINTIKGFSREFDNDLKKEIIENSDYSEVLHGLKQIPPNTEWLVIIKQNDKLNFENLKFSEITHDY